MVLRLSKLETVTKWLISRMQPKPLMMLLMRFKFLKHYEWKLREHANVFQTVLLLSLTRKC